ncbi:MAG: hypothetical protein C0599_05535 [Salinivirgaceae bacterium]|nr:MAG: hypothetical protein C0599_05535 [Salinivirgaceae bacterium]
MDKKKIILIVFGVVVLAQLFIPAKMIWDKEDVLETGTEYKFRTAPVDPNDPFRGKYITLSFNEDVFIVNDENSWERGEPVYVSLTTDSLGFAKIESVTKVPPTTHQEFVKATVGYVPGNGSRNVTIDYPFERFYMEESKAPAAEEVYRDSQLDSIKPTWALVSVKNGEAVLKDVLIDGVSIREVVKNNRENIE